MTEKMSVPMYECDCCGVEVPAIKLGGGNTRPPQDWGKLDIEQNRMSVHDLVDVCPSCMAHLLRDIGETIKAIRSARAVGGTGFREASNG